MATTWSMPSFSRCIPVEQVWCRCDVLYLNRTFSREAQSSESIAKYEEETFPTSLLILTGNECLRFFNMCRNLVRVEHDVGTFWLSSWMLYTRMMPTTWSKPFFSVRIRGKWQTRMCSWYAQSSEAIAKCVFPCCDWNIRDSFDMHRTCIRLDVVLFTG